MQQQRKRERSAFLAANRYADGKAVGVSGAIAGISGLMLVLPVLGVVMVVCETIGAVVTDPRLMARYWHGRALRKAQASVDL